MNLNNHEFGGRSLTITFYTLKSNPLTQSLIDFNITSSCNHMKKSQRKYLNSAKLGKKKEWKLSTCNKKFKEKGL